MYSSCHINNKHKFLFLSWIIFSCFVEPAVAQMNYAPHNTGIGLGTNAAHIASISKDSLVVIAGSMYLFTVDSPGDQGPVPTNPGVKQFVAELRSQDGSVQQYKIANSEGIEKTDEPIVTGDRLKVIAQDGSTTQIYPIVVRK